MEQDSDPGIKEVDANQVVIAYENLAEPICRADHEHSRLQVLRAARLKRPGAKPGVQLLTKDELGRAGLLAHRGLRSASLVSLCHLYDLLQYLAARLIQQLVGSMLRSAAFRRRPSVAFRTILNRASTLAILFVCVRRRRPFAVGCRSVVTRRAWS